MRPGKRERIAWQQKRDKGEIIQKDYVEATRDTSRAVRQKKSGSKLHPKVYNQFRAWTATNPSWLYAKENSVSKIWNKLRSIQSKCDFTQLRLRGWH